MTRFSFHESFDGNPVLFEGDKILASGFSGGVVERADGTTYVAVASGALTANGHLLKTGMFAAIPGPAIFVAERCCAMLVTVKTYRGIFLLGGPIENGGRLRYIDGCTDTGLIQPLRQGDPCLNYLHFPAGIRQTEHHHPSHRIGLVFAGEGLCHHDDELVTPMRSGGIFIIPAGTPHRFETADHVLRIVAFHPDSEFGPTDESHQMLNATLDRTGMIVRSVAAAFAGETGVVLP